MKHIASVLVLASALVGVAHADNAASKKAALPQGMVTVEDIQTVVVESKQWTHADEEAFQRAQAPARHPLLAQLAGKISQGLKYAMQ